ncbi:MAG: hypothetical protein DMD99_04550 [Candidatus Rokuibacteriota bacterium]|nr:MAG: hypothetical protein DMD99_04550 [Candidatus Rokubacteria bacterium]
MPRRVADESPSPDDSSETQRHRRGLRFRKRDDYAVELFKEAQANLQDVARVDRILLELGRFYNPLLDGPIVDLATRRRIVELLQSSRAEEARRLLDERLASYARVEEGG